MTRGISASSLLFREQAFLCAAGETGEQSWVQLLKSPSGEGLSGASGFKLSKPTQDRGVDVPAGTSSPHPSLSYPCVMCNDLFKVNPLHLRQFGAYPSTASLPLRTSCLDHKLNLTGKALGGGLVTGETEDGGFGQY
nr:LOW QUALITY PROTEIN: TGFB1-induced anti-apoptotic factor 1 [Odocoileus virginianus texanus]